MALLVRTLGAERSRFYVVYSFIPTSPQNLRESERSRLMDHAPSGVMRANAAKGPPDGQSSNGSLIFVNEGFSKA